MAGARARPGRRLRGGLADPDQQGASAVEYGLIVFAIAALITVVVFAFGGVVSDLFATSCSTIKDKAAPSQTC